MTTRTIRSVASAVALLLLVGCEGHIKRVRPPAQVLPPPPTLEPGPAADATVIEP